MKGGQSLSCDSDALTMRNTRCARSNVCPPSLQEANPTTEPQQVIGRLKQRKQFELPAATDLRLSVLVE